MISSSYTVTKGSGCYKEIVLIATQLQALAISLHFINGHSPCFERESFCAVEGRHLPLEVHLPLNGPLESAINGSRANEIIIPLKDRRHDPNTHPSWIGPLDGLINQVFHPLVVAYYEKQREKIEVQYASGRNTYPPCLQMGWAVRNAVSHNGTVFGVNRNDPKPVTWQGANHSKMDDRDAPLLEKLFGADLLILLLEMDVLLGGTQRNDYGADPFYKEA